MLATLVWILIVAAATDDEFREDFEREFDDSELDHGAGCASPPLRRRVLLG